MKRIIYSLYIDLPEEELDFFDKNIVKEGQPSRNMFAKEQFKKNYIKIKGLQELYAKQNKCDYILFEGDDKFKIFKDEFKLKYPFLTSYNIVNFYKIYLLYDLSKKYDEILYLDFDVVPITNESFFSAWNLSKGICVYDNNSQVIKTITVNHSIRSPSAKYYNCQAMLLEYGLSSKNDVINTGIIGARKEDIQQLDFFGKFKDTIDLMTRLRNDTSGLYPQNIIDMFRYDNETIFSYKREINKIKLQWLDDEWHYFFDKQHFIPDETKIVHCVCKDFDMVWRRYA